MSVTIRPAARADIPSLQTLIAEVDRLHAQAHPERFNLPAGPARSEAFLLGQMEGEGVGFLVAELNGELVGFTNLVVYSTEGIPVMAPRRLVRIETLGVRSDCHGQGIGQALMAAIEAWAREHGIRDLELGVWEFNRRAIEFYERQGYQAVMRRMWKRLED
jgi:ribosomal protein S18 acetylase RimI-like enzyme